MDLVADLMNKAPKLGLDEDDPETEFLEEVYNSLEFKERQELSEKAMAEAQLRPASPKEEASWLEQMTVKDFQRLTSAMVNNLPRWLSEQAQPITVLM